MSKDLKVSIHNVQGCLGKPGEHTPPREENDYYATQPIAAEWLIKLEKLSKTIWEPACGEGHLSKVFVKNGYTVRSTDLIDRGYGQGGVDFLDTNEKWDGDIITNPPFIYADEFIKKALDTVTDGHKVCMFLKVQFLEGVARRNLYNSTPPRTVWVSSSRIKCGRNGVFGSGSMIAYAWFVWEKGFTGTTELKWFN